MHHLPQLLEEAGQNLLLSMDDVIDHIKEQAKAKGGMSGKEPLKSVSPALFLQTVEEILTHIRGGNHWDRYGKHYS